MIIEYRHPLNFAVNVDIGDPANIKTAKILTMTNPCSQVGYQPLNSNIRLEMTNVSVMLVFG